MDILALECPKAVKYLESTEQFHMWSEIVGQVSKIKGSGILKSMWCKANKDLQLILLLFTKVAIGIADAGFMVFH